MAVVAFVGAKPESPDGAAEILGFPNAWQPKTRLRFYSGILKFCFISMFALWVALQIFCLLSLFLHFTSGIVVGRIDGSLSFKVWYPIGYLSAPHALSGKFVPFNFPFQSSVDFSLLLVVSSFPFTVFLWCLCRLFDLYTKGAVFTEQNTTVMRRLGHSIMATGYSPLLLGPVAHMIGMLRPITGMTGDMIMAIFLGLVLLAIAHVMEIGQSIQQDQEAIL